MSCSPQAFSRYLRRTVLVPVVLLAILAVVFVWQISHMVQTLRQVDYSDRAIADQRLLMGMSLDMETGLRGYLLTGDGQFLEPYSQARKNESRMAKELEAFTTADPVQSGLLYKMQLELEDWKHYADGLIQQRRNGK